MNARFGSQATTGSIRKIARLLLFATFGLSPSCGSQDEQLHGNIGSNPKTAKTAGTKLTMEPAPSPSPPALRKWEKPIVCQPHLIKADGTDAHQGTGFFVRTPSGRIAAVSSAHFLNFEGSPVVSAEWLQLPNLKPVAVFTASWGMPGRAGDDADLTTDYWIMPVPDEHAKAVGEQFEVLEFDLRERPNNGERVWLPNKDHRATLGFVVFDGRVLASSNGITTIELDGIIGLQSQSGSPIISRQTHKVIGTLCSGAEQNDKTFIWIAPVSKMRAVVSNESNYPALKTVIGKTVGL